LPALSALSVTLFNTMKKQTIKKPRCAEYLTTTPCQGYVIDVEKAKFPFSQLQELVGGYVEVLYLKDGSVLCFNEDGRSLNLPLNIDASLLAGMDIVGNAVLLSHKGLL